MTRALKITKGHATGNAFALFRDPAGLVGLMDTECALLTAAHPGEKFDGVIRAVRSEHIPDGLALLGSDSDAEWFMDHRNPDGSTAAMCGNALRVFVAFLMAEGLVDLTHGDRIAIGTRDGVKDVQVGSNGVFRVDLGRWRLRDEPGHVKMPQVVANGVSSVLQSFTVEPFEPLVDDGIGRLSLRMTDTATNEFPSWATATVAAALNARHRVGTGAPNNWRVDIPDGSLGVQMFPTEDGEHVSLSGRVKLCESAREKST
jgi:diaminopimelate epimerase